MTEELELFCEDMDEQLGIMESTLLDISEMDIDAIDTEMINQLFRAMHTLKGNSGMFGFDQVVTFAHVAENLLDEVRNDRIALTTPMIDTFLLVLDHSKTLVEVSTEDTQMDEEQLVFHNELIHQLQVFLGKEKSDNEEVAEVNPEYILDVKLKEEFFKENLDFPAVLKFLDIIGDINSCKLIDGTIPDINEIEPSVSYMHFLIEYKTDEEQKEIESAFELIQEHIELTISHPQKEEEKKEEVIVVEEVKEEESKEEVKTAIIKKEEPKKEVKKEQKHFSLRVDSTKIDRLINQVSEMVIANAKITEYASKNDDSDFQEAVAVISGMIEEVRDGIMNIRMVQVGDSFAKFRRIIKDTMKSVGKDINFEIVGGETELDKTVVEKISDPLVHMLRNSVDHGVEMPEDRVAKGKNPQGNITLSAYTDAGTIVIEIKDDGAGINKDVIFGIAVKKGIVDENDQLSDNEIFKLLFAAGFSTAKTISNISGRGVGMDVVRRNIEELRGSIDIDSTLNVGTTMTIRLPLTLAIIDGFLVQVGGTKYIIPLDMIQECIELDDMYKEQMVTHDYITLRSQILPILDIRKHFGEEVTTSPRENIIVVKYGNTQIGLQVDELYGEFQTVIKPLGQLFENVAGVSGGTILGSGEIALIFDIPRLIEFKIINSANKEQIDGR